MRARYAMDAFSRKSQRRSGCLVLSLALGVAQASPGFVLCTPWRQRAGKRADGGSPVGPLGRPARMIGLVAWLWPWFAGAAPEVAGGWWAARGDRVAGRSATCSGGSPPRSRAPRREVDSYLEPSARSSAGRSTWAVDVRCPALSTCRSSGPDRHWKGAAEARGGSTAGCRCGGSRSTCSWRCWWGVGRAAGGAHGAQRGTLSYQPPARLGDPSPRPPRWRPRRDVPGQRLPGSPAIVNAGVVVRGDRCERASTTPWRRGCRGAICSHLRTAGPGTIAAPPAPGSQRLLRRVLRAPARSKLPGRRPAVSPSRALRPRTVRTTGLDGSRVTAPRPGSTSPASVTAGPRVAVRSARDTEYDRRLRAWARPACRAWWETRDRVQRSSVDAGDATSAGFGPGGGGRAGLPPPAARRGPRTVLTNAPPVWSETPDASKWEFGGRVRN